MADIKTRDKIKGTIRTIDKAAVAGERMKAAYIAAKEKGEHSTHAAENSVEEYAADRYESAADRVVHEGVNQFDRQVCRGVQATKENIHKAKDAAQQFKEKRAVKAMENQAKNNSPSADNPIKTAEHTTTEPVKNAERGGIKTAERVSEKAAEQAVGKAPQRAAQNAAEKRAKQSVKSVGEKTVKTLSKTEKTVKETARSAGKKTVKTAGRGAAKTAQKSVKTAERTAKTTIKTSQQAAKTAQKTAQATAKATKAAAQAARAAGKAAVVTAKAVTKATIATVKAIIAATKALVAAIAAGGWVAVVVIIIICLIALVCSSVFGIFFSGEDSGTGQSMQTAVAEINTEYDNRLTEIQSSTSYDVLEMSGSRAVWKEVLAVYAVKTNTDPDNPQEVATMDDGKKQLLSDIFWEMNEISHHTESESTTVITETDDGNGNIIQTETTETVTTLYITVSHKTVDEMAAQYRFNQEQKDYLAELLKDENNELWIAVLYGIQASDDQIVAVALSQLGNVGGAPYWSWYGFNSRVEWCACFVSWCANECGYIETGIIPKFAGCVLGEQWFRERDRWQDGDFEPTAGHIIFFDWEGDGETDHVGIVEKCENGIVYTVEGNSGDACRQKQYAVGSSDIYGYGIPAY